MVFERPRAVIFLTAGALLSLWLTVIILVAIFAPSFTDAFFGDYSNEVYTVSFIATIAVLCAPIYPYIFVRKYKSGGDNVEQTARLKPGWFKRFCRNGGLVFLIAVIILGLSTVTVYGISAVASLRYLTDNSKEPYLTWIGDPSTSVTITWETATPVSGLLYIGKSPDNMTEYSDGKNDIHHTLTITGLDPFTVYYYRVNGFNKIYKFRTAALPGDTREVTFIVYGDNRYDTNILAGPFADRCEHERILEDIRQRFFDRNGLPEFNFTLNLGDVVLWGGMEPHWRKFHEEISVVAPYAPYMIAFGNHEYYGGDGEDTPNALKHGLFHWEYNSSSGRETDYYFAVGNCLFIVLGTGEFGRITPEQAQWVDKVLAANADKYDWIFMAQHFPLLSRNKWKYNVTTMLRPLMDKYGVDVSLAGHVHDYQRYEDTDANRTYIVSGGGGASLTRVNFDYSSGPVSYIKEYHYMFWRISGKHASVTVITSNGTIFEEFDLYT